MIRYLIKLWSSNTRVRVQEAIAACQRREADGVEIYHNPTVPLDWDTLGLLRAVPATIHNTHTDRFHTFHLGPEQLAIWQGTLRLADFFGSDVIVVHPGKGHTPESFRANLALIDDPRIHLENMPGLDLHREAMDAVTLDQIWLLAAAKPLCFDFEKAVKAAIHQGLGYQDFITAAVERFQPNYFHISGCQLADAVDQHINLWEAEFDVAWVAAFLAKYAAGREIRLVFETPLAGDGVENDLANINWFKERLSTAL